MPSEARVCQNCQRDFPLGEDDFEFFERLRVPAPGFCHECRWQRQLSFRNARNLYRRKDDHDGKEIISIYSPDKDIKVYEQHYWFGDGWDPLEYGLDIDFSVPFFEQVKKLIHTVPFPSMNNWDAVNSDYCNFSKGNKNCYLVFGGDFNEDTSYSAYNFHTKNSGDLYWVNKGEYCHGLVDSEKSSRAASGNFINSCLNVRLGFDLTGCQNCVGCLNLRNQKNRILNEQLDSEEYKRRVEELDLGSYRKSQEFKARFEELRKKSIFRSYHILNSANSTGDNIYNAKDCKHCFDIIDGAQNCKYILLAGWDLKDSYSVGHSGSKAELLYESLSIYPGSRVVGSWIVIGGQNVHHSINLQDCANVFGCVGLRKKKYCILNKQYTQEEYEALLPKLIQHMKDMPYRDSKGRTFGYGEFFPYDLSPFGYNETMAYDYYPLTKAEAGAMELAWKEPEAKHYEITLKSSDLPDHIKDVDDGILKETIECEHAAGGEPNCNEGCATAFKMIPQELNLYRQLQLPLPRICPNCRHGERIRSRNPAKLWHRSCECRGASSRDGIYSNTVAHAHGAEACPAEFETPYAPERPEVVYCEQCYNAEVV